MRLSKAWLIASKDFKTYKKKRSIFYSMIGFELLISIGLPLLILFMSTKPAAAASLPVFIKAFSFWFVIGSALMPVVIASYSLVGEKVQKSLEPLLATPTTDEEILAGKSLAAFLPAMLAIYTGALFFTVLVDIFAYNTLQYLYYPNWDMVITLLLLAPLACLLGVGFNVLVSSRSNDVRAAQQLGSLVVLPFAAVYFLSEFKAMTLDTPTLLIIAGILLVLDGIVFYLVKATFQREKILTNWK